MLKESESIKLILKAIRDRMIERTVFVFAFVATSTLLPAVVNSFTDMARFPTKRVLVVLSFWVLVYFRKKINLKIIAASLLVLFLIISIMAIMRNGILGSGSIYLMIMTLLTGHFFGWRAGVVSMCVSLLITWGFGYMIVNGTIVITKNYEIANTSIDSWIYKGINFATFMAAFMIITQGIYTALVEALSLAEDRAVRLEKTQEGLMVEVEERKAAEKRLFEYKQRLEHIVAERTVELKRSELNLIKARDAAEASNAAKGSFLANMSHEIRTPLNSVIGFSELLQNKLKDPTNISFVKSIKSSGQTLLSLINDILDLSKIEAGKMEMYPQPVNIRTILEEMRHVFLFKAEQKNIDLSIEVSSVFPQSVMLDDLRFRQILLNLIGNAIKFTDKGYVKVSLFANNIRDNKFDLKLMVEDSGIGIKKELHSNIFEAFNQDSFSNNKRFEGTGLGLYITKGLVDKMNGTITVDSEFLKGAKMIVEINNVTMPMDNVDEIKVAPLDIERVLFNKSTILVVDDVQDNREYIKQIFERSEITVIEAESGYVGIEKAEFYMPDLIFMDIRMPGIDGYETTKRLKQNPLTKNIPVVVLTAAGLMQCNIGNEQVDFDGILKKPVRIVDVYKEVMRFVKYTEVSVATKSEPTISTVKVSEEHLDKSEEIIAVFEHQLMSQWKNLQKKPSIKSVEEFAIHIITEAKNFELVYMQEYGQSLLSSVLDFDVERKERIFANYPKCVAEISKELFEINSKKCLVECEV